MNNFIYNTPTKVFFGKNQEDKLGEILKSYNIKKVLLHYGKESIKKSGLYDKVINQLKAFKIDFNASNFSKKILKCLYFNVILIFAIFKPLKTKHFNFEKYFLKYSCKNDI